MGIIAGEPIVGMTPDEIELFGKTKGIAKVSKRDLPIIIATKAWGATTVSATILMAKAAGIEVFVTGGIGGVHRGASETWDVSRDLYELGSEPVTVVCAGCKAILDIDKTLEVLETQGVSVLSYKEKDFANFYCRKSGKPVDYAKAQRFPLNRGKLGFLFIAMVFETNRGGLNNVAFFVHIHITNQAINKEQASKRPS